MINHNKNVYPKIVYETKDIMLNLKLQIHYHNFKFSS